MDPRFGLDGCGKFRRPTGIRSPDRPARSESLYRMRYPGPPQILLGSVNMYIYIYIYIYIYKYIYIYLFIYLYIAELIYVFKLIL